MFNFLYSNTEVEKRIMLPGELKEVVYTDLDS